MAGVAIARLGLGVGGYARIAMRSTTSVDAGAIVFCGGLQSRVDGRRKNDAPDHKQCSVVATVGTHEYPSYKSRKTRSWNKKARRFVR